MKHAINSGTKECMCGEFHNNIYTCMSCWHEYNLGETYRRIEKEMDGKTSGDFEMKFKQYLLTLPPNRKKKLAAI